MYRVIQSLAVLALIVVIAAPVSAADDKKKKKRSRNTAAAQIKKRLAKAELTEEQQKKVDEIVAKHSPKLQEANKVVADLIGPDARKKRAAAQKSAREAGKKGKELQAAVLAALGLDDEKLAAYKKAQAAAGQLRATLNKEVNAVLTAEQREKIGIKTRKGGDKKKKGAAKKDAPKKKKAADK
ncbi:MAG: hypothetical protein QGG36_30680 [Pirellulaceae bacterium]|nr:hypothetical protein [Pirellulaceae bacterium]MDP7020203.1 hypothetical protein [Pirellulaceae bacterium]